MCISNEHVQHTYDPKYDDYLHPVHLSVDWAELVLEILQTNVRAILFAEVKDDLARAKSSHSQQKEEGKVEHGVHDKLADWTPHLVTYLRHNKHTPHCQLRISHLQALLFH